MAKVNLNSLARRVTLEEGLKQNLTVAQVKEVIKITINDLADNHSLAEVVKLLEDRKRDRDVVL